MKKKLKEYVSILYQTVRLQIRQSMARPMYRFCLLCNPIMNTIFMYEMFMNSKYDNYISYVIMGAGLMGVWCCCCFSTAGDINRERYMGTLSLIYASPGNFGLVLFGKILANTILSLFSFVLSFTTAVLLSWQVPKFYQIGAFLLAFLMTVLSIMALGTMIAYMLMLSRKTELYMNLIEIPFVFICGFSFPVDILPKRIQIISNLFAPTWSVRMLRMSMTSVNSDRFYYCLNINIIELIISIVAIYLLHCWANKRIYIKGTLEVC